MYWIALRYKETQYNLDSTLSFYICPLGAGERCQMVGKCVKLAAYESREPILVFHHTPKRAGINWKDTGMLQGMETRIGLGRGGTGQLWGPQVYGNQHSTLLKGS